MAFSQKYGVAFIIPTDEVHDFSGWPWPTNQRLFQVSSSQISSYSFVNFHANPRSHEKHHRFMIPMECGTSMKFPYIHHGFVERGCSILGGWDYCHGISIWWFGCHFLSFPYLGNFILQAGSFFGGFLKSGYPKSWKTWNLHVPEAARAQKRGH